MIVEKVLRICLIYKVRCGRRELWGMMRSHSRLIKDWHGLQIFQRGGFLKVPPEQIEEVEKTVRTISAGAYISDFFDPGEDLETTFIDVAK